MGFSSSSVSARPPLAENGAKNRWHLFNIGLIHNRFLFFFFICLRRRYFCDFLREKLHWNPSPPARWLCGYLPILSLPAPPFICPLSLSALFQMSLCLIHRGEGQGGAQTEIWPSGTFALSYICLIQNLSSDENVPDSPGSVLSWRHFASSFQWVVHRGLQPVGHTVREHLHTFKNKHSPDRRWNYSVMQ